MKISELKSIRYRLLASVLLATLVTTLLLLTGSARADDHTHINADKKAIPFKQDPVAGSPSDTKVIIALVIIASLAVPTLYFLKKKYPILNPNQQGGAKINIVETRMLSPRLKLYLVEVNGESLLIAQGPDGIKQLSLQQGSHLNKDNNS